MNKILIIVRGIPGSGKSSFAELISFGKNICTADDYFMVNGEYKYDGSKQGNAHAFCQYKCKVLMEENTIQIVVANTSVTEKELKPYYDLAKEFNYKVFSVIVENRHEGQSIHNVPEEVIEKMKQRFSIKL